MGEGGSDNLSFRLQASVSETTTCIYINFLSLSKKESVIVGPVITVHTLRKKGEVTTV